MTPLAFVADLIHSLAWPLVALLIAWRLHRPIEQLIPLLTSIKYKDWQFTFGKGLTAAEALANSLPADGTREAKSLVAAKPGLPSLGPVSARAGMENAWTSLEHAVADYAKAQHVSAGFLRQHDSSELIKRLEDAGAVSSEQALLFATLKGLRDAAQSSFIDGPSVDDAVKYGVLSERLSRTFVEQ